MQHRKSMIIAGATGLVGRNTLATALDNENISHIYSLSRRSIEIKHHKLTEWLDPELNPPTINSLYPPPTIGMIALGTTLKKAGSKEKLRAIDVTLVIKVAKDMQALGVQHIIVVSCIGASTKGFSHYLCCKGEMEMRLQQLDFIKITFLQPGPLSGFREETRVDEKMLQCIMKIISPFMIGALVNYKPIASRDVAKAIIQLATEPYDNDITEKQVQRIDTSQMLSLSRQDSLI